MLKFKCLIILVLFSGISFAEPCTPHRGKPYPWEGTGACTGNNQLVIPLETTGLSLIYNSIGSDQDFGFGKAAWRLSQDHRLIVTTNKVTLDRGDGTQIEFKNQVGGVWKASTILSRAELSVFGNLWVEKNPDGSKIHYQSYPGNFWGSVAVIDSKGNQTTITRDSNGLITEILNPFGRKITLKYENGRAISLKDYQEKIYYFSTLFSDDYGTVDRLMLTEIARPDGSGWRITYPDPLDDTDTSTTPTDVLKLTEPDGSYTLYNYYKGYNQDALGVLFFSRTWPGRIWALYNFEIDSVSVASEMFKTEEFFNQGRLSGSVLNGVTTQIIRHTEGPAIGMPSIVTNSLGQTSVYEYYSDLKIKSYQSPDGTLTQYTYNQNHDPLTVVTSTGKSVTYNYNTSNHLTGIAKSGEESILMQPDSKGNILSVTKGGVLIQQYSYNDYSQITSRQDSITGLTTQYEYVGGYLSKVTDALGNETVYTSNELGLPLTINNPDGTTQFYSYDDLGQNILDKTVGPTGIPFAVTTTRQIGQATASFTYPKRKTIEASFNLVPLLTKILPWKDASAADAIAPGNSSVRVGYPNGASQQSSALPGPRGNGYGSSVNDSNGNGSSQTCSCSILDKPIIYLYPEKTQTVKVVLELLGKLLVTYPDYDSQKGWNVKVQPDGTLTDLKDGKEYSYLFWEGKPEKPLDIDWTKGFIIQGKDTRQFMQDILPKMGLTPREYNEFIVYWYPRLKDNAFNYIHFAGKPYTDSAKLDITPKPDSMLRVFMAFKPLTSATEMKVTPQEFPKFVRKGFVVVEWGGGEVGGPEGTKLGNKVAAGSGLNRME